MDQLSDVINKSERLDIDEVREPLQEWVGGKKLDLDKKMADGRLLRVVLSDHFKKTLDQELKNQEQLLENIKKWNQLYKGKREKKNYPYAGVANTCSSMTRSDADAIFVRVYDAITNKRRYFLMNVVDPNASAEKVAYVKKLERAFDHYLRKEMRFKDKIRFPLLQTVKSGTGVGKIVYETKNKTIYRYATPEEKKDKDVKKFKTGGDPVVKEVSETFAGPNVYPVAREDWVVSSDALDIDDAYMCGFRFRLRKPQVKVRAMLEDGWDRLAVSRILPSEFPELKKQREELHGRDVEKTEYEEPYEFWELYSKYDVDDDGQEDDIVITIHMPSGSVVDAKYNPTFYGYRPFFDLKGSPVEYTYDGEGVCEILEGTQDDVDAIRNLRLDRLAQINMPMYLVQPGVGIDNFKQNPGKVWVVDGNLEDSIRVVQFPDVYPSTYAEEDRLVADGDRAVGITPNVLGVSTAERPVARETFANIEEANKKFKNWTESVRSGLLELGYKLLECFAQHQPVYTYTDETGGGVTIEMPMGDIRNFIELELEVSSEQMNMEIRREIGIVKFQLLRDYMTGMTGIAQILASPQAPGELKKVLLSINDIGVNLMRNIIEDFGERVPEEVVLDLKKSMDTDKVLAESGQPPPGPQGEMPPAMGNM